MENKYPAFKGFNRWLQKNGKKGKMKRRKKDEKGQPMQKKNCHFVGNI